MSSKPNNRKRPSTASILETAVPNLQLPVFKLRRFEATLLQPTFIKPLMDISTNIQQFQKTWAATFAAPLLELQRSIGTQWREIAERAAAWGKEYAKARELLIPHGWLISPSLPARLAPMVLSAVEDRGESVIDEVMMAFLTPGALQDILQSTYDRPSFARFSEAFDKALAAHAAGDPELSIPIWLLGIDGICTAELGISDVFSRLHKPKDQTRVRAKIDSGAPRSSIAEGASDAVIRIMAELGRPSRSQRIKLPKPLLPRRHDILHGALPEIGDAAYSARCVLVLEHLHWCLERVER